MRIFKRFVLVSASIIALVLVAETVSMLFDQEAAEVIGPVELSGEASQNECEKYVQILSAEPWAEELGRPVSWVEANHRINLWRGSDRNGRGSVVGKVIPGSRARVLEKDGSSYLVASPFDGSEGWVSAVHVERAVMQDPKTDRICESGGSVQIKCPDGITYFGNDPDRACQ